VDKGECIRAIQTYTNRQIQSAKQCGEKTPAGMGSVSELCPQLVDACDCIARLDNSFEQQIASTELVGQVKDLYKLHFNFNE
jgi:hypothetical protein